MSRIGDRLSEWLSGWGASWRLGRADRCDYRRILNACPAGRALLASAEVNRIAFVEHRREPAKPLLTCQPRQGDEPPLFVVHIGRLTEADLPLLIERIVLARQLRRLNLTGLDPVWSPADAVPAGRLMRAGQTIAALEIAQELADAGWTQPLRAISRDAAKKPLLGLIGSGTDTTGVRMRALLTKFSETPALMQDADRLTLTSLRLAVQNPAGIDEFMLRPFTQGAAQRMFTDNDHTPSRLPGDVSPSADAWRLIDDADMARAFRHLNWAYDEAIARYHSRQPGAPAGSKPKP